ncbi:MAG: hypothetical protein R3D34_11085 [Nitratireductor sp.]
MIKISSRFGATIEAFHLARLWGAVFPTQCKGFAGSACSNRGDWHCLSGDAATPEKKGIKSLFTLSFRPILVIS